jgi:T-complex protein 1 subunit eta
MLERCAATAMASKLISSHAEFFAKMVVEAVLRLEQDMDINMLGIKKESGGSLQVSHNHSLIFICQM